MLTDNMQGKRKIDRQLRVKEEKEAAIRWKGEETVQERQTFVLN